MKKISLLFLSGFLAVASYSQVTFGLRLAPSLSMNRVKDLNNTDNINFSSNGSGIRFAFGPTIDFHFSDNVAFSTGAWYLSSRSGLSASNSMYSYKEVVSLQSIQIPITFKLFTNEIATNMKLYFQLGGLATFNFYEKFKESSPAQSTSYEKKYNNFDVSLYVGAGISYKVGESNALFAGFYYNRGLINMLNSSEVPGAATPEKYKKAATYNNDLAGLEVGITF